MLQKVKEMTYNYLEQVKADVLNAMNEYAEYNCSPADFDSLDDYAERLNEILWTDDSVTGNGSGSYTFSTYDAEQNLNGNWDLMCEAAYEFGFPPEISANDYVHGPEWWDVTIRCYLLSQAIYDVIDEHRTELEKEMKTD